MSSRCNSLIVIAMPVLVAMANLALCFASERSLDKLSIYVNGKKLAPSELKVVAGRDITHDRFPFLVSIDDKCAGAIIGPRQILTSAECVEDY